MNRIIEYSFYALFFLVPLILTPWNYELFEFNKMLTVYVFTIIITAAWAIRMITTPLSGVRRTPFDIPILLFLASQILATVFSIDIRTSILGYYSRFHGGLLSTISYIILYYAFVSNLIKRHVLLAIRSMLLAAALVAFYAIAEHFGIDKNLWVQDVQSRVFSTLGQPNWLAAYLVTIMFIPIALLLNNSKLKVPIDFTQGKQTAKQQFKNQNILNFILLLLIFNFYFLTLLYTKSRSGLLGFALAYIIFWLALKVKPLKVFLLVTCLLLLVSFADGLRWIPQVAKYTSGVKSTNTPEVRPATGSQLESGGSESGDIRKIVWKGALRIWRRYPLFGSGVETFAYSYYNFRPPEHNLVSEWDFLYNKAHNEYLNFFATTGIVGLGTYLLLQAWIFIWLFKHISILNAAFLAGLVGLSVSNFFGFSTVSVALLFFLFPAFALTYETQT